MAFAPETAVRSHSAEAAVSQLKDPSHEIGRQGLRQNQGTGLKCDRQFRSAVLRGGDDLTCRTRSAHGKERHSGTDRKPCKLLLLAALEFGVNMRPGSHQARANCRYPNALSSQFSAHGIGETGNANLLAQ